LAVIALLAGPRRGIAAVVGCLGLLFAAGAMVCCAPAAAAPFSGRPTVLANSGFRPPVGGYAFANYGDVPGRPNLGSDEVRQLYGDGVCAGFSGGVCVLSPPALAWMQQENAAMAEGHCVGFSVTAMFFYAKVSTPLWFGAAAVSRLTIAHNQLLARAIAYGYAFQTLDSVRRAEVSGSPRAVLTRLISALRTGSELYTLGITQPDGSGGHAVTPYEIERLRPNHYAILVYDNNYPRTTRTVQLNTKSNSWSFDAAPTSDQPASRYTGNTATHSLFLLPTLPGLGVQPCPFCSAAPATTSTPTAVPASVAAPPYEAIRLQTAGPVVGHLLIIDRRGRRVGFVHGRLVNQIPGSRIIRLFVGGTRTWLDQTEPEYELPTGQRYTIELTTAGARRGRPAQSSQASVTVLEPGFVAAVRGINIQPAQHDQITVPADGHAISFVSHGASRQAPELVLGNAADGANDHEWNITDQRTPSGRPISASLNVAKQSMSLVGAGRYDLSMDVVGNGVSVFAHRSLGIGAGITAGFDYANWSAGDTMPVTETKHGIVVGRLLLSDEPDPSDTGSEFAPTESTPAPAEPQPHPEPPGASATTLVCSPATVPVGDTTTCHVDVSDLDSYASAAPTGQVDFSSDQSGSFSEDRCTLSNATCEVTYTPTATGSRTHDLTASYDGDHTYHPSHDTIAVNVTPSIKVTPVGAAPGASTATLLQCEPSAVPVNAPTACTATVTNTGSGAPTMPTGDVEFSSDESGSFSENRCTLSDGVCKVTYTPTAVGSGTHDLTVSYDGDHTHQPSDDISPVQVHLRSTDTSVECDPTTAWGPQKTTCTATVTDTDSGTQSTPTGTVTFASDSSSAFNGNPNPCTLSALPNTSASCSTTYTPPSYSSAVPDISASYSGDSSHAGSAPSAPNAPNAPNALASRQLAAAP
jgi:hypothetical protein